MANYVLKETGYDFSRMTKEEIFTAWEHFLAEEKARKYTPYMDFDCDGGYYISNFKAFKGFVGILNGEIGTRKSIAKKYGMSEEMFENLHQGEYTVVYKSYGEETITENEIAEIFKIKEISHNLNWCAIERNYTEAEANKPAVEEVTE